MSTMQSAALIAAGLAAAIFLMVRLAIWARKRSKGAIMTGAILSAFAPDPTLEAQIRLAEESKQSQHEEDEEGEPR